jgi:hypothetical protein
LRWSAGVVGALEQGSDLALSVVVQHAG